MRGQTIQDIMRQIDPRVRFPIGHGIVSAARGIAGMAKVPGCDNAPIYAEYEDERDLVIIGIARSEDSPVDAKEWLEMQLAYPVLRSIDRVDLFGNMIEGGDSDAAQC